MNANQPRKPMGKAARILISLAVTLVFGLVYFYLSLPALNLQDGNFYTFAFVLCLVFVVASLFTSGFRMAPGSGIREYIRFVKTQCLPAGVLMVLLIAVGVLIVVLLLRWLLFGRRRRYGGARRKTYRGGHYSGRRRRK